MQQLGMFFIQHMDIENKQVLFFTNKIFNHDSTYSSTPSFGRGNTHLSTSGENAQVLLLYSRERERETE
mgnify:FL=1